MTTPQQIGRYHIQSELGRGGLAVVYRATDSRSGGEVALKVLPQQFASGPTFRTRFESDVKAIARLKHPAIVPILDYGEDNVRFFYAMPYLTGGALPARIAAGPLPPTEITRIFVHTADALHHAHQEGIIHRNLRAGSILFDSDDQPHVSDFGIVTMPEVATELPANVLMGGLAYMAPEQLRNAQVDHRADIYALGVLLYEMIVGQRPFQAQSPQLLAGLHLTAPVPSIPDDRPLAEHANGVIARAMAKNPLERFASADDMAQAWQGAARQPAGEIAPTPAAAPRSGGNALFTVAIIMLALAVLVLGFFALNTLGVLPGRQPTSGDVSLTQTHTADALGYSVQMPAGWLAQDASSFGLLSSGVLVTVAAEDQSSYESILTAIEQGDFTLGGPVFLGMTISLDLGEDLPFPAPVNLFGARAALQLMKEDTPMENESFTRTRNTRVDGQRAAWTDFTGEDPTTGTLLAGRIVTTIWADQVGIFIGAAPADQWPDYAPTFEAMLASIDLVEPTNEPLSLVGVETSFGFQPEVDSQGEFTGGDGLETAEVWAVPVNKGQPLDWQLPEGPYADNWKFEGGKDWPVTITVRARQEGFDPYIRLIAPDGTLIGSDDDSGGGQWGYDSQMVLTLPESGKYTIRVTSYDALGGPYSVEVTSP